MKIALAFAFALSLAACGSKSKPATTVEEPQPVQMDVSKLGAQCGEAGACEVGTCAKYYGIAGPSGPEFSSCEIGCGGDAKSVCPEGTECTTIADGPGSVCRMPAGDTVTDEPQPEPTTVD
jgi:hypothetical protein